MGLFERFPYTNFHELNAEWLLKKMKELDAAMENFKATESLKFADPIIWDITTQYQKSTIVLDPTGNAYLSVKPVPAGVQLNNDEYWLEIFNFTDYTRTANKNLTAHVETNTTRATAAYNVDDWLIWEDVLYKVTAAIAIDDTLVVGTNLVHFTVEDFIKAWISYANGLIQQYKNDIDYSEAQYRSQLAQDIADTTNSLQAQLNAAIAGATVDSEVINARVGADGVTYPTLGDAIRTQFEHALTSKGVARLTSYDLNEITDPGWYYGVGNGTLSDWNNLPDEWTWANGTLLVLSPAAGGTNIAIQILFTSTNIIRCYERWVIIGGTASPWVRRPNSTDNDYFNYLSDNNKKISLSGQYADFKHLDWIDGYIGLTGGVVADTVLKHAFVRLIGAGSYVRMMRTGTFGESNAKAVTFYDDSFTKVKTITATRIGNTDFYTFNVTDQDIIEGCHYTTLNGRPSTEHYGGLFYNTSNYNTAYDQQIAPDCCYEPETIEINKAVVVCVGDSISFAPYDLPFNCGGWFGRLSMKYQISGDNYAINGGTITDNIDGHTCILNLLDNAYTAHPDAKYVLLEGGTNDADIIGDITGGTIPVDFGSWSPSDYSGSYDRDTFCGAVETYFYKAINYFPNAKIGFIIPMEMSPSSGSNRRAYFDEIVKIANKWHINVLDIWKVSHLDAKLIAYYDPSLTPTQNVSAMKCYYDGQHPTSYGYNMMQPIIESWIKTL